MARRSPSRHIPGSIGQLAENRFCSSVDCPYAMKGAPRKQCYARTTVTAIACHGQIPGRRSDKPNASERRALWKSSARLLGGDAHKARTPPRRGPLLRTVQALIFLARRQLDIGQHITGCRACRGCDRNIGGMRVNSRGGRIEEIDVRVVVMWEPRTSEKGLAPLGCRDCYGKESAAIAIHAITPIDQDLAASPPRPPNFGVLFPMGPYVTVTSLPARCRRRRVDEVGVRGLGGRLESSGIYIVIVAAILRIR